MHSRTRPLLLTALLGGALGVAACGGSSSAASDTSYRNTGSLPRAPAAHESGPYGGQVPGGPHNIQGPGPLEPIPRAVLDDRRVRAALVQVAQVRDDEPEEGDRPLPTYMMAASGDEKKDAPPTTIRQQQNDSSGSSSIGGSNAPPAGQPGSGTGTSSGSGEKKKWRGRYGSRVSAAPRPG